MQQVKERFDRNWIPVTETGCWLWTGRRRNRKGYGAFEVGGVILLAHRASFVIHNGALPRDKMVCHKCDTPACVNPDHLYAGTASDNMRDAMERGKLLVPTSEPILSSQDAQAIRNASQSGIPQREICARFGISKGTVHRVTHGLGAYAAEEAQA